MMIVTCFYSGRPLHFHARRARFFFLRIRAGKYSKRNSLFFNWFSTSNFTFSLFFFFVRRGVGREWDSVEMRMNWTMRIVCEPRAYRRIICRGSVVACTCVCMCVSKRRIQIIKRMRLFRIKWIKKNTIFFSMHSQGIKKAVRWWKKKNLWNTFSFLLFMVESG